MRTRRAVQRVLEIFDYRTFIVAGVFTVILVLGLVIVRALGSAHDATVSADQRGAAASRRIDLLNTEISELQAAIAQGRDQRGQLATAVAALSAQVRQLHAVPVVIVSPDSSVTIIYTNPTASPAPRPSPTATRTVRPRPSPSPTCTRFPVVGMCHPKR